jgi:hypothetical protein
VSHARWGGRRLGAGRGVLLIIKGAQFNGTNARGIVVIPRLGDNESWSSAVFHALTVPDRGVAGI